MTEDDLRKFDKEVLVQFIYADSMFNRERTLDSLLHYKKRLRYKKLSERYERLIEEWSRLNAAEDFVKCRSIAKKVEQVEKQMSKILGK